MTLAEADTLVSAAWAGFPLSGDEEVPLWAAAGRVLAAAALAPVDLPPFDRSLVDGWAVGAGVRAGACLRAAGAVRMGEPAPVLPAGAVMAVPTGGMLPAGTDAVVMQEAARLGLGEVCLEGPPRSGANLIRRGEDAPRGAVLVPAGCRLRPLEVAMLAAAGVAAVRVFRQPRVAILSSGDELDPLGTPPGWGRVPDANGVALAVALQRDGCIPQYLGIVPDERARLAASVRDGLAGADALLCTGGSSVGERDFMPAVLAEAVGAPALFTGIAIRPGRPTAAFGARGRRAVALPGHTVSALVVYELLLRALVLRLGGEAVPRLPGSAAARLAVDLRAPLDRDVHARVRLQRADDGGVPVAVPLAGSSAAVGSLALADGLVRCPAGETLAAGALVTVRLLD